MCIIIKYQTSKSITIELPTKKALYTLKSKSEIQTPKENKRIYCLKTN